MEEPNEPVVTEQDLREEKEPNGRASRRTGIPRGCKKGSHNSSRTRHAVKLRVAAWRERQKEKELADAELAERTEQTVKTLRAAGFTMFGETEAMGENGYPVNASTPEEELAWAISFARALGLPGPRKNQTIRNFVEETLRAHVLAGNKMLNLQTGEFAPNEFSGLDVDKYDWLAGMDTAIPDQAVDEADELPLDAYSDQELSDEEGDDDEYDATEGEPETETHSE